MSENANERKMTSLFERYLTVWVGLCIVGGIVLGKIAPDLAKTLDGMSINVNGAPVVSIPIAACLFFMMYPIMVKIDFAGCILLGIAPCTAMVLVWGYLSRGNDGLTLVMVALNSLTMLVLYGILGGFLLGVGKLPIPWQALLLSVAIYVALPLVAGFFSRKWIIGAKGEIWFKEKFLGVLTPVTIGALLLTLVLLFSFKGEVILANPLTILWIAIPLFIQTILIFALGYAAAKFLKLKYEDAAPAAMIGASNHFEVAIATAVMLFGLSSGAALATVVGVLIEVPVMLMLVAFCKKTTHWFEPS
nr:bile acid:sodium symporter [uncultured Desulfobacter sp.]